MKFKKVPENVFHDIQFNLNVGDNDTKSCSGKKTYLLMNKLDTSFVVYLTSKKPIPKDRDIYFLSPDGIPYKGKIDKKGIAAVEVIVIITIIAILATIIYGVIVGCLNEQNRITEGVIVDKSYTAEKATTNYRTVGDAQIPYTSREPAHYHFQLE